MVRACILLFMCACSSIPKDSAPEEFIEEIIRDATGLDIDLTSEDGK